MSDGIKDWRKEDINKEESKIDEIAKALNKAINSKSFEEVILFLNFLSIYFKIQISQSIDHRKKNKSAVKNLVYWSTIQNISRKDHIHSVDANNDSINRRHKSISMCEKRIHPYKNLPKISPFNMQINSKITKKGQVFQNINSNYNTINHSEISRDRKNTDLNPVNNWSIQKEKQNNIGTYSVVDLLQRPAIAGEYIPKKGIRLNVS